MVRAKEKSFQDQPLFKRLFWLFLPLLMIATFPALSHWLSNSYQVSVQDLILPLILDLLLAIIISLVFIKKFSVDRLATYIGSIFVTSVLNYGYGSRLALILSSFKIQNLNGWQGMAASLMVILAVFAVGFGIFYLIHRFITNLIGQKFNLIGGIILAVSVIWLMQAGSVVRVLIIEWPQFFYSPPALTLTTKSASAKPDIYYIVLDRYTSQSVLQSQFGFDNSDFVNYLADNGFSVDPNAKDNYPYTTMSIASTLSANYNSDMVQKFGQASSQTIVPYHETVRDAPVIQQLKSLGYNYHLLGTWYEATNQSNLADEIVQPEGLLTVLNHTFTLNEFPKDGLVQSVFWQFISHGLRIGSFNVITYSAQSEVDATKSKLVELQKLSSQSAGGRFIFAHILVPHDPYYFNANGSLNANPSVDNVGESIKQKYVNQVQYINQQMESIISSINKNSKNQSIVVLQSDEGPYSVELNENDFDGDDLSGELLAGDMTKWSDSDLQMKYGILAAYHIPGVTTDQLAAGGDSVNIFRLIFNTQFDSNLSYLPRCYYAYPNGRGQAFLYSDITKRLTGQANSACPVNSNFSNKPS